jgi:hypothetical protein
MCIFRHRKLLTLISCKDWGFYLWLHSACCKVWGRDGSDYDECRLLGYNNPFCTSQEIHYFFATEHNRLMLLKYQVFTAVTVKDAVSWDMTPCGSCKNRRFGRMYRTIIRVKRIRSSETSLLPGASQRHIQEDSIIHLVACLAYTVCF